MEEETEVWEWGIVMRKLRKELNCRKRTVKSHRLLKQCRRKKKLCGRIQSRYQVRKVKRLYCTRYFHYLNPYAVNQSTVRKQLLNIHVLSAEVGVILKYGIRSVEDAKDTYWKLILENRKSGKQGLGRKELEANQKYQALRKEAEK